MSNPRPRRVTTSAVFIGVAMLLLSGICVADPPVRVARLSYFSGPVSFAPAGEEEWVRATPNRPLVGGDRLWADAGARAELEAGSVAVRLGASTSVNVLNLDDNATQIELAQGTLYVRAWRIDQGEVLEIDTPNLAFTISSAGRYRIDVDAAGNATTLAVLAGAGEAYGEGAAYRIAAGERYTFGGTGLRDYDYSDVGPPDAFERWAGDRDRSYDTSRSARYVSRDVIGYQDLDQYGTWSAVASYGNVWYPRSVPSGWAPYRTGHWSWIDPWGWTWIDEAPWGFAPYHYGRWAFITNRWGWIPGPVDVRPVYAPALVAFIGGGDFRLSLTAGSAARGVAWFPLGPGEVFRPAYHVSRDYFTHVNVSNTRVTNVNITNVYNSYTSNSNVTNVTYRNREAPNGVTAVPSTTFVQSQPVARAAVKLPRQLIAREPAMAVAQLAPTRASLAASRIASAKPPQGALRRDVVARTQPPPPPAAFAARQAALAANPGRPVETVAAQAKPAPGDARRNVRVVAPTQPAAPPPKNGGRGLRGGAPPADRGAGTPGGAQSPAAAAPAPEREAPKAPAAGRAPGRNGQRSATEGGPSPTPTPPPTPRANGRGSQRGAPNEAPEASTTPPVEAAPAARPPQNKGARNAGGAGRAPGGVGPAGGADQQHGPGAAAPPAPIPPRPARPPETRREAPPAAAPARPRRQEPRRESNAPPSPKTPEAGSPPPTPPAAPPRQEPSRRPPAERAPEPRRAAPPPPVAQPPARQPQREAPKAEPKRDEGKRQNKDKDQKDKEDAKQQ
ncbi:MAG: DUF6600 domain-containing protein [Casimicrobiaceae bacterium]